MPNHTDMTQTNENQVVAHTPHRSKRYRGKGGKKPPPATPVRYKIVPMDRNPAEPGAPPIVNGKGGRNLKRIMKATGTHIRFLNRKEQHEFELMEVNTYDARVLEIKVNSKVHKEEMNDYQRLTNACKMVAASIKYWRDVAYPPPEEDEDSDSGEQDALEPSGHMALAHTGAHDHESDGEEEGGAAN